MSDGARISSSILVCLIILLLPAAEAEGSCMPEKTFASWSNSLDFYYVVWGTGMSQGNDSIIGRFWQPGFPDRNQGGYDDSNWLSDYYGWGYWLLNGSLGDGRVQGCPEQELVVLCENTSVDETRAEWVLLWTDETPAGEWDFDFTKIGQQQHDHFYSRPHPAPQLVSSVRSGTDIVLTVLLPDIEGGFYGWTNSEPFARTVTAYRLYQATVPDYGADPGRLTDPWTFVTRIPYRGRAVYFELTLDCGDPNQDHLLASGLEFNGGEVESRLVSGSLRVECGDNDRDGYDYPGADCDDNNPGCNVSCVDTDGDGFCGTLDCDDQNPNCQTDCDDGDGDGFCATDDCDDELAACTTACATGLDSYGGSGNDEVHEAIPTIDGGSIAVGETDSFGAGSRDVWVVKLDATGHVQWEKAYGGSATEAARSVVESSPGRYFVTGKAASYGWFGDDIWVLELDDAGNVVSETIHGDNDNEEGRVFALGPEGEQLLAANVLLGTTGWDALVRGAWGWTKIGAYGDDVVLAMEAEADGRVVLAGHTDSFTTDEDAFVVRMNWNGAVEWQRVFGGSGDDRALAIRATHDGGYVFAGSFTSTTGDRDLWVVKLNAAGEAEWSRKLGGSFDDWATSIELAGTGYVVAGTTGGAGDGDMWVLELDANGQVVWQRAYGSATGRDEARSIRRRPAGGYLLAGLSQVGSPLHDDFWVLRLDEDGRADPCTLSSETYFAPDPTHSIMQGDASFTSQSWFPMSQATTAYVSVTSSQVDHRCGEGSDNDPDFDDVPTCRDNCPDTPNPAQQDPDGDGLGTACDPCDLDEANDLDGDGVCGDQDNCPTDHNDQSNADGDLRGDACDPCPLVWDPNPDDMDGDGLGNYCDPDIDGDGTPNVLDADSDNDGIPDEDGDGIADPCTAGQTSYCDDNCLEVPNPDQQDGDGDGVGDLCDLDDGIVVVVVVTGGGGTGATRTANGRSEESLLEWNPEADALGYNVYSGTLSSLSPTDYGNCYRSNIFTSYTGIPETPPAGDGYFYLVTADMVWGEGSLGNSSDGSPRISDEMCP